MNELIAIQITFKLQNFFNISPCSEIFFFFKSGLYYILGLSFILPILEQNSSTRKNEIINTKEFHSAGKNKLEPVKY